jgi:hypothetical protein
VQRGEQPRLHLGEVLQPMAFGLPGQEGPLHQIGGIGLYALSS